MQSVFALRSQYQRVKALYLKYERLLMPASLVVGFFVDYFTFTNIQIRTTLIVLASYWLLTAIVILFIHAYDAGSLAQRFRYIRLFAPLLIQYMFGALLGGSFIFYWFSGSVAVSWPLILIFVALMVANDHLRRYFHKPLVQMSIYSFITISFFSLLLPFACNSLSPWLFAAATAASAAVLAIFVFALIRIRKLSDVEVLRIGAAVLGVLVGMDMLYFGNVIPPIPLSLRAAGAYHSVQHSNRTYTLLGEPESLWQKLVPGQTLHLRAGERAYVYSAIFAPADLHTTIVHDWQYYDEQQQAWISKDKIPFSITGGRKQGYRGYSWKSTWAPGEWRVSVETTRGQVLGRIRFSIALADSEVLLEEVTR